MIAYEAGAGSGTTNSSARIAAISDPRSSNAATYLFTYNTDAIPHLTGITTGVYLPGETWQFTYTTATLTDPFASASHGSTTLLASAQQTPISLTLQSPPATNFSYNASAELVQYTTPMGGSLSWTYQTFTYSSGIKIREVTARSMNDAAASLTNSWTLTPSPNDSSKPYHQLISLVDIGAASQKVYGSGIPLGNSLVVPVSYAEENSSGSTILLQKSFTWTQDSAGNAYVGTANSTLNPGTSSVATSSTQQLLDTYGNLTQQIDYNYANSPTPSSTPYRTYNFTYLGGTYATLYIRNRLTQATATSSAGTVYLAANGYDGTTLGALVDPSQNNGPNLPSGQSLFLHDANYGTSFTYRGNPTATYQNGTTANYAYLTSGVPYLTQDGAGMTVSVVTSGSTAYSLPSALTPNSNGNLATSMAYTSSFALTSVTGPNGVTQSVTYDSYNRPSTATSADGAQTNYSYSYSPNNTQTATISTTTNGTTTTQWKKTTYDGFGRTISVVTGYGQNSNSYPVTEVDTQYGACGCSPLGKVIKTSMPYAPGSAVNWNTNTYDTSGRTTAQIKPDGSTTTTSYTGNSTTVTDPAGKWKTYVSDSLGGTVTVYEPNPNIPNSTSNYGVTYYTLNAAGQIVGVSVQRNGVAQNRSFTWSGTDLASSTDPETGTTTYQYDGNHHVLLRTDAKGQQTRYTYDAYERLTETQYYTPTGSNGSPVEVSANRVTYGYDTNPNNPYDYYTSGRLTQVSFSGGNFSYYYDYNQAGRVTANQFMANNGSGVNLKATYAWDTQGRMTSMTYPSGAPLSYQYDAMGRLSQITAPYYAAGSQYYNVSATATYNAQSQLSTLNYGGFTVNTTVNFTETRTHNTLMQLATLTNTGVNMQYNYTAGHNNGRVAQTVDGVLGETVNYTYDMWNRLTNATATNGNWGEQYTFDNFGNLTGKTPTAGSAPAMNWPGATNQTSGTSLYDANGNPYGYSNGSGPGYLWDGENHLATDQTAVYTPINYTYDPWGRRVWKQIGTGRDNYGNIQPYTGEVYFYGATGQKLETYSFTWESSFGASLEGINIYFGGKLLQSKGVWVATDRLGSVRANSNQESMSYWPYGEERTSTANGHEKFATYTRDGVGQDYAEQRYYNSSTGAFWNPDPGGITTANPKNPSTWNRYAYVLGDPINHTDRHGLYVDAQDCIDNPDECTNCLPGSSFWGQPPGCDDGDDTGGGPSETTAASSAQGSCTSQTGKIATTLTNLATDIYSITAAKDTSATASQLQALDGTLINDVSTEEQSPLSYFVGGHFNLDVSLTAIASDLGGSGSTADNTFLTLFKGTTFDGVRQGPVQTTDPGHQYWLHSKPSGNNLDFHFDRFNPWGGDVGGALGHLGVDLFWGNVGTHCLDPAWRSN